MASSSPPRRARLVVDLPSLTPLPSAAERAAEVIRNNILEGRFPPGAALPEAALSQALQVSRNTVREAFRTLMNENLLVHEPHRGVTVRWLTVEDVRDIYLLRRMLELSAIDALGAGQARFDREPLAESIAAARRSVAADDWVAVGTDNLRFHEHLVGFHGSPRVNKIFQRLMIEVRLGFLAHADLRAFHEPYLELNQEICDQLIAARHADAHATLSRYLDGSLEAVVKAVAAAPDRRLG
ncbi:MAG: GntR family transcriptional regulator [Micromonosporaceae bacterium]